MRLSQPIKDICKVLAGIAILILVALGTMLIVSLLTGCQPSLLRVDAPPPACRQAGPPAAIVESERGDQLPAVDWYTIGAGLGGAVAVLAANWVRKKRRKR